MSHIDLATKMIAVEEGFSATPYYDTLRIPTYGHGFVCGDKNDPLPPLSITLQESLNKLRARITVDNETLCNNPDLCVAYEKCNEVRQAVMLSMSYQLGVYGVLKFKAMLSAIAKRDWEKAAKDCLDSLAARQAPNRFARNASMLITGELDKYYK